MNAPKTHTLCVAGADSEVAARIASLLDELRTRLDDRWRVADYASADLLLIQTDSVYGHMDWLKAEGNGRMVAALTSNPAGYGFALAFPVTPAGVIDLLNAVSARLDGRSAPTPARETAHREATVAPAPPPTPVSNPASTPAHVPATAAPTPARAVMPSLSLLDLLEGRSPLAGKLKLHGDGLPDLYIDAGTATWHSAASLKGLSAWCLRPLVAADIQPMDDARFGSDVTTMPAHPAARLAWLVHLVRHDGKLRAGLDPHASYKLSRWPQSEREFPKHFRIATVMLKQSRTLDDIATESGAGVADVANFINAYDALGYIERQEAPAAADARATGLFGRMKKTGAMS